MKFILVHNSQKIVDQWLESLIGYLETNDSVVVIVCNGYENNDNSYLYAKNKNELFSHLSKQITDNEDCKVIFRINLFYDKTINSSDYQKYSMIQVINDLFQISTLGKAKFFVYDEQLVLSNLLISSLAPCNCFKKIDDIFNTSHH